MQACRGNVRRTDYATRSLTISATSLDATKARDNLIWGNKLCALLQGRDAGCQAFVANVLCFQLS